MQKSCKAGVMQHINNLKHNCVFTGAQAGVVFVTQWFFTGIAATIETILELNQVSHRI